MNIEHLCLMSENMYFCYSSATFVLCVNEFISDSENRINVSVSIKNRNTNSIQGSARMYVLIKCAAKPSLLMHETRKETHAKHRTQITPCRFNVFLG